MIKDWLAHLHWSTLPIITMLMFVGVFLGALIWVYRKNSDQIYAEASHLPLSEPSIGSPEVQS